MLDCVPTLYAFSRGGGAHHYTIWAAIVARALLQPSISHPKRFQARYQWWTARMIKHAKQEQNMENNINEDDKRGQKL